MGPKKHKKCSSSGTERSWWLKSQSSQNLWWNTPKEQLSTSIRSWWKNNCRSTTGPFIQMSTYTNTIFWLCEISTQNDVKKSYSMSIYSSHMIIRRYQKKLSYTQLIKSAYWHFWVRTPTLKTYFATTASNRQSICGIHVQVACTFSPMAAITTTLQRDGSGKSDSQFSSIKRPSHKTYTSKCCMSKKTRHRITSSTSCHKIKGLTRFWKAFMWIVLILQAMSSSTVRWSRRAPEHRHWWWLLWRRLRLSSLPPLRLLCHVWQRVATQGGRQPGFPMSGRQMRHCFMSFFRTSL